MLHTRTQTNQRVEKHQFCSPRLATNLFNIFTDGKAAYEAWDRVRDLYNKAKKRHERKTRSGAAGGADAKSTWQWWEHMTWLDDFMKKQR